MPSFCFAVGCSHRSGRDKCRYFRFPINNPKLLKSWENMCRRSDRKATHADRICSCHFVNGKKENGPTLFLWNESKRLNFPSPEKRRRITKAKITTDEIGSGSSSLSLSANKEELPPIAEAASETSSALSNAEIYFLQKENEELKAKVAKGENTLSFEAIKDSVNLIHEYTGLPTPDHFLLLLQLIKRFEIKYYQGWSVQKPSLQDQLLCALMKLRLNLTTFDLAYRFKISNTTVNNIIVTIIYTIHGILFEGMMNKIPSKDKNALSLPKCFNSFRNCRLVLDCTEIELAVPHSMEKQKAVFSHYKQRHTFKALIGVAPNATITYVSELYPGSISDKNITKNCGILNHLSAGDLILADRGFLISDLCSELGVTVNIPPFLHAPQFTPYEIDRTTQIARARIHVERAINRLKAYRILNYISMSMRPHASVIVQTCAALVNLQYSLLKENELHIPNIES